MDAELAGRFVDTMRSWLINLPFDLKILYEASSDENLSRETRELMIGTIIYTISPNDFVSSDREDFTSYVDDCVLLRLALKTGLGDDEDAQFFRSRFPEFFDTLDAELKICEEAMGDVFTWLSSKVSLLTKCTYKSKKVSQYFENEDLSEALYEDGLGFRTEYPVDEDDLADKFKKASTVLDLLNRVKESERVKAV